MTAARTWPDQAAMPTRATRASAEGQSSTPAAVTTRPTPPLLGLLIPTDLSQEVSLLQVPDSSPALSRAIGGGPLDEVHADTYLGRGYTVYGAEDRRTRALPINVRVVTLSRRLGWANQAPRLSLRGDLLLIGTDPTGQDTDLPIPVLQQAALAGLIAVHAALPHP